MTSNDQLHTAHAAHDATFAARVLPWIPHVARFARTLASRPDAVDDLVQETFVRAYDAWHDARPAGDCRRWLFAICRETYVRRAANDGRAPGADDPAAETAAAAALYRHALERGLGAVFDRVDLRALLLEAAAALPDEYREVVVLVDIERCGYQQAASALAIPVETIRSRLFKGRRLLQESVLAYAERAGPAPL